MELIELSVWGGKTKGHNTALGESGTKAKATKVSFNYFNFLIARNLRPEGFTERNNTVCSGLEQSLLMVW